mgnify:CR=1 FL=1
MAETMKDYEAELEASFKKIEEGDILTGTVVSVDDKEIIVEFKILCRRYYPGRRLQQRAGLTLKKKYTLEMKFPPQS